MSRADQKCSGVLYVPCYDPAASTRLSHPAILRDALLRGGLNQSTLDLLISGSEAQQDIDEHTGWDDTTFVRPNSVPVSITKPADYSPTPDPPLKYTGHANGFLSQHEYHREGPNNRSFSFGGMESLASGQEQEEDAADVGQGRNWRSNAGNQDQRSLCFTNLPEKTTHAELTSIIKGGRLLDVYVRNDRTATVSFVEGAKEFLNYAKKTDLYLRTKRIEVQWNDRQFRMPSHVGNKIGMGASRNIVIRNGTSRNLTEQGIRDDMEHIHNLVVISVTINKKGGDVFISTNSVHNALFARTCMMSRQPYKGLKIEYYPDECAVPLPKVPGRALVSTPAPAANRKVSAKGSVKSAKPPLRGNIYALLAEDGEGSSDVDEQALPGFSENGVKINWADSVAVA